jgi:hypothetical protein
MLILRDVLGITGPVIGKISGDIESLQVGHQFLTDFIGTPTEHEGQNASRGGIDGIP